MLKQEAIKYKINKGEIMELKKYELYQGNEYKLEKLVMEEKRQYIHMVIPKGDSLPIHYTNADLFMTVIKGVLSISLDKKRVEEIKAGTMIQIPFGVEMDVSNKHDETLKLIVVKTLPEGKDKI